MSKYCPEPPKDSTQLKDMPFAVWGRTGRGLGMRFQPKRMFTDECKPWLEKFSNNLKRLIKSEEKEK